MSASKQKQKQEPSTRQEARTTPPEDTEVSSEDTEVSSEVAVSDARPLPLDQLFDLLKNERRRLVLSYLREHEQPVSTSDLAEHVAAHETGKPVERITSNERKRAYVGLYQCHLPKMDGMNVVEFNKPRGLVWLGENASTVYPYLTSAGASGVRDDTRWALRYLLVSATAAALLLTLATTGNRTVTALGLGIIVLGYGICSALHLRTRAEPEA